MVKRANLVRLLAALSNLGFVCFLLVTTIMSKRVSVVKGSLLDGVATDSEHYIRVAPFSHKKKKKDDLQSLGETLGVTMQKSMETLASAIGQKRDQPDPMMMMLQQHIEATDRREKLRMSHLCVSPK